MIQQKLQLRSEMRAVRKRAADASPEAARQVATHVSSLPSGTVVALYQAIGSEMDAGPLADALAETGVQLCLPVVLRRDAPMVFRRWEPGDPLEDDAAGCPAPLLLAAELEPDLILTPLVAFDASGGRLGQGGGYYDRTFAARPDTLRIGLAYAAQQVERLELEDHDIRLHGVLTEKGYRAFS